MMFMVMVVVKRMIVVMVVMKRMKLVMTEMVGKRFTENLNTVWIFKYDDP